MHILNNQIFHFINNYNPAYIGKLNKNIKLIYRNHEKKPDIEYLKKLQRFCKSNGYKIYLSNDLKLAIKLNFDGVYISSFNKRLIIKSNTHKKFTILGSAHDLKEIRIKEKQGVQIIFLSPVFINKNNRYLGIYNYLKLRKLTRCKSVALGGIDEKNLKQLYIYGINEFASIKFIEKMYEK
ncbi:thiamine phosphate synthase [Candidatus Pelagibacter communis]|uniref:thiamine phosphate synthase n=1 Tax=Pelagibacter ubique TaxID=198252 RepID=UPI000B30DB92|nr:thiamine phosphate synthase [Candidatus Pelagibacter ubique]